MVVAYRAPQVPSVQEWATYGTEPGVLVGIIVLGCATVIIGVLKFAKWFIVWHTTQLEAQRVAHRAEVDKLVTKLLEVGADDE